MQLAALFDQGLEPAVLLLASLDINTSSESEPKLIPVFYEFYVSSPSVQIQMVVTRRLDNFQDVHGSEKGVSVTELTGGKLLTFLDCGVYHVLIKAWNTRLINKPFDAFISDLYIGNSSDIIRLMKPPPASRFRSSRPFAKIMPTPLPANHYISEIYEQRLGKNRVNDCTKV